MKAVVTKTIPISEIVVGAFETRAVGDVEGIRELAASIRADGLLQPLMVRTAEAGYELVFGHRRYLACVEAGVAEVACTVVEADDAEAEKASLIENYHRRDVSPMERAVQIAAAAESGTMAIPEIARVFSRTAAWVQEQIAMLAWPDDVKEAVHARIMAPSAAEHLAKVIDDDYRAVLMRSACENGCTERTAIAWLQGWRSMLPAAEAVELEVAPTRDPTGVVVPMSLCIGCRTNHRPDHLGCVYLCPECICELQSGAPVPDGGESRRV